MKIPVENALVTKSQEIQRGAELLMQTTRDWQTIRAYLCNRLGDIQLTDDQQKKLDRYQYIYNQLVSGKYTDVEVVSQVIRIFKVRQSQAYEDMNCSREIFNSVVNINKRFEINLQLQVNRNMLRKAEEAGDWKAVAALEKNRVAFLKLLPDEEESPADMFEGHSIEAIFDPRLLGVGADQVDMKEILTLINAKRGKKINVDLFEELTTENTDEETPPL